MDTLHDWRLLTIQVFWPERRVAIAVGGWRSSLTIDVEDFDLLNIPAACSWGPSAYINKATIEPIDDLRRQISIEMQSGDRIVARGRNITELVTEDIGDRPDHLPLATPSATTDREP